MYAPCLCVGATPAGQSSRSARNPARPHVSQATAIPTGTAANKEAHTHGANDHAVNTAAQSAAKEIAATVPARRKRFAQEAGLNRLVLSPHPDASSTRWD